MAQLPCVRCVVWATVILLATTHSVRAGEATLLAETYAARLPSPSQDASGGTLYLELVVNGLASGQVVPIRQLGGKYYARASDLAKVSVSTDAAIDAAPDAMVDIARLDDVEVAYDTAGQRLSLTVPADWLPPQIVGVARRYDRTPAAVSRGMLFNYDVFTQSPIRGAGYVSAWTEQRLFDTWGTLSNTGVYRRSYGAGRTPGPGENRYLRYDTTWTYSDQDRMVTYAAGDLVTSAISWTSAVRIGGVSIARDFNVRPDIVTYPLPRFAGQAAVPTAVDLFINGSKAAGGQVNPGPFVMNNVPFINGAGEATVVTTDALGRRVATTIPFYVANTLLQKGLSDYAFSAGAMRRDYGIRSFSYGKFAMSGTVRHGLTDLVTVEGHAEGGERFGLGGVGFNVSVGRLGVVNASTARSILRGESGQQYAFGYAYSSQLFSVAFQRTQRSAGFRDLSAYDVPAAIGDRMVRRSTQATAALNLGTSGGSIGTGYFDVRSGDGSRTRIVNVSYTRQVLGRATLYASLNRAIGQHGVEAQIQLIVPLGGRDVVTASGARDRQNQWTERVQYSRSVPTDGGLGWNLGYAGGASHYQQADLTWRNRYFQMQGGVYGDGHGDGRGSSGAGYTRWANLQGTLVVMDGSVMPSNRIADAFVLIDTQGRQGIPVKYENQRIGETDSSGHLLVPWTPSYYTAKYEIDPLNLPGNVRVPVVERRVAVRQRAGALVTFPVQPIVSASITLTDSHGKAIPVGASVRHLESGQNAPVGWSGATYFENLSSTNHLRVTLPDGRRCDTHFFVDVQSETMHRVGPLVCND
ncbi:F1 capsule-anchoring protein [Pandoraea aquatica]|uniref:F1 capsule-anchoring protein n=1 Tax=Pandoraea aquatica TaxID=2508290 RepID=A0A5E4RLG1_9BURK|nr:F1 capsule-anchoring protein [Pandoraea aquatica]